MENQFDLFAEHAVKESKIEDLSDNDLNSLSSSVKLLMQYKEQLTVLESQVKDLSSKIFYLESDSIPTIMMSLGFTKFNCSDGSVLKMQDVIRASIPSESGIAKMKGEQREAALQRKTDAINWLEQHNLSGIIKNEVVINVGKDEALKNKVVSLLKDNDIAAFTECSVHSSTLSSTMKDLLSNDIEVPAELFNLYQGKLVKFSKAKRS